MGALSKVMQKLKSPGGAAAPPAAEPAASTASIPHEPGAGTFQPEPSNGAGAGQPPTHTPRAGSDEIQPWDPQRVDPALICYHNRYASTCEQYRAARARLLSMNPDQAHRLLAITSSVPEEGKSVTTLNLAITMAEGGEQRVAVADTDFRRSSLARMVGVDGKPGLAEVFLGRATLDEIIRPTPFPNLKLLPAGQVKDVSFGDLLAAPYIRETLLRLREAFNYTFLDTPPVTTVSDVSMLAPLCDAALMVVEMGRTPEPTAQLAVRTLQTNNVNVVGCLLSRHQDARKHYYDRYYGYYHRRQS